MSTSKARICIVSLLSILVLAGCDSIPFIDTTSDYKSAGRGKPLEVPPDLTSASASDTYNVPGGTTYSQYSEGQGQQEEQTEKILPTSDSVKMERAGSQRWLVVQAPPEKVWPVVREFWNELGFAVRTENPQTGVMETEWVDPSDLTKDKEGNYLDKFQGWLDKLNALSSRQKFRTRIDRGTEEETTEVYLSHRSVSDVPDDGKQRVRTIYGEVETGYRNEDFEKKKGSKEGRAIAEDIDAELLRRLMVRMGVEEQKSHTIMAAASTEKRATFEQDKSGNTKLTVNDPFDRAWRRVGLALDRIGFVVEDRDRSRGVFFVRYSDISIDDPQSEAKKKGLLDTLKFCGDDEEEKSKAPAPKKEEKGLTDKLKFWGEDKDKAEREKQYRIQIGRGEETSAVTVTDQNGQVDVSPTANRILAMLYDQLK
ncbi:MAG: outer membrane protein assembly factor BamC [Methylophilaceae bacterium]